MRKFVLLFSMVLFASFQLSAQNQRVSGTVTDSDGTPIGGVTVLVEGSNTAALTDPSGLYSISVSSNANLVFTFFGMETQTVPVSGRSAINVTMVPDALAIENVVVTATGMTRSERTLGYAASTVTASDLVVGKSSDIMTGVIGKVAGVSISSAGASGSSQKVIVRGFSSLTGSNQPLYVIDGMPFMNEMAGRQEMNNAMDFGNQANAVNPENIESMTILKGASATALWGSRAANGVVMITTKSGKANQEVQIDYNLSVLGSGVLRVPQTQQSFGQGWQYDFWGYAGMGEGKYLGTWVDVEQGSWGPKLDGRPFEWNYGPSYTYAQDDPRYVAPRQGTFDYKKNSIRDFYDSGLEVSNTISVSGGSANSGFYVSYGNFSSNGILPTTNDTFQRNTFTFNGNTKFLNDRALIRYSVNYSREDRAGAMSGQGDTGSTIYNDILQSPTSLYLPDTSDWTGPYDNPDSYYTPYALNPYWILDHNSVKYQNDRVWGNIELNYDIVPGLKAVGRVSGDFATNDQRYMNDIYSLSDDGWSMMFGGSNEPGWYRHEKETRGQIDATAMLNADYQFGDFSLNAMAGWNVNQRTLDETYAEFSGLGEPGWFSFSNYAKDVPARENFERRRMVGALAQADFGYKNWAFVTLSARNDWSSTLPIDNNSFFYWGANAAVILTDMLPSIKGNTLNFLKVRASNGQTGNDADMYQTRAFYTRSTMGVSFANVEFPIAGNSGFNTSTRMPALRLKPEITTETEFGFDMRLFQSRLTVDFTYYNRSTTNQIMSLTVAPESGYASRTANVGKIGNKGIEIAVGGSPVRNNNFSWDVTWTFTRNRGKVIELLDGLSEYSLYSLTGGIGFVAQVGQPLGVFTYNDYVRVPEKETLADGTERTNPAELVGKYVVNNYGDLQNDPNSKQVVGTSEYKFTMGLNNQFSYKNLSLGFTFDWRHGGMMYSAQKSIMYFVGTAPETAYNERNPFILSDTVRKVGEEYVENNIPVGIGRNYNNHWYDGMNPSRNIANSMLDRSYIKLRELNLTYSLPEKWFKNTPVGGLQVSLVGRNLFLWTPDGQGFIDPDVTNYGNDLTSQFGEFYAAPSTRVIGGSLKVIF
ncbi:MAG: SusC/RagA family TonB-linked outer membrane protein [Alistipes sp.]|jgi:TonB-linked SusC/RagA family outer membrane protein|nr:SusC/RagA family TonB-linked outer membrane protein [Alistipes sp.]